MDSTAAQAPRPANTQGATRNRPVPGPAANPARSARQQPGYSWLDAEILDLLFFC